MRDLERKHGVLRLQTCRGISKKVWFTHGGNIGGVEGFLRGKGKAQFRKPYGPYVFLYRQRVFRLGLILGQTICFCMSDKELGLGLISFCNGLPLLIKS